MSVRRTFQALRIAVNDELSALDAFAAIRSRSASHPVVESSC